MAVYRKITLSLPEEVLREAERIAAQRNISVARLLTEKLEGMAAREDNYRQARARHLAALEQAADLGTYGQVTWSRDSLHEGS